MNLSKLYMNLERHRVVLQNQLDGFLIGTKEYILAKEELALVEDMLINIERRKDPEEIEALKNFLATIYPQD